MRWHFALTPPDSGVANMALDEALMRRAGRTGDAVFRLYGWSAPTLSLGRNQRARGCYNLADAAAAGVGFVRRPTGGRALLHHREITYSASLPVADATEAAAVYSFINEVLLAALRALGVGASRATGAESLPPGPRPCFDVPSAHEIVVGARKLVGSAQWRRDGVLLQHGSILVRDDQAMIGQLMLEPPADTPAAASLGDVLGRDPALEEVAPVVWRALADATGTEPAPYAADAQVDADVVTLAATYSDDAWTWRR